MKVKKFFKKMFSEQADVDYFPPAESQPLISTNEGDGDAKPASTATESAAASGLESMEEQRSPRDPLQPSTAETEETSAIFSSTGNSNNTQNNSLQLPGLTDGYEQWSQTFGAFQAAILNTIAYYAVGVIAYSYLLDTKWSIIDSVYFSVVVFTTVGYGDLAPTTRQGEIFTIFFAIWGITIIGIFLSVVGDMFVERRQKSRKDSLESARRKYLHNFQHGTYQTGKHPGMETPIEEEEPTIDPHDPNPLKESFLMYLGILKEQFWAIVSLIVIAIPVIWIENWDAVKGIYWMVITGTTVGLGDETPTQPISKALCILYIPVAVYSVGRTLGLLAGTYQECRDDETEERFLNRALTLSDIQRMDFDSDGSVSREEFLIYMLTTLQKVDEEDINEILGLFRKLDRNGDGALCTMDVVASVKKTNEITTSNRPMSNRNLI
ncbi:MAG: hypothetical protein SGARI_001416 [Bacillariaceae sp.]